MEQELKRKDNNKENQENTKERKDEVLESPLKPKLFNGTFDPLQTKQFCKI
jgi:hypothetical protein